MELEQGTLLHQRYRIQGILGKGGMGVVYTAIDESLGVHVVVKENSLEEQDAIQQFRREATILAGLRHHNLPRVTDHFVIQGQGQYLVMDFIEGEDLKMRLQRLGALPEKEVMLMGIAISDALDYLHSLTPPVLHRDIKPGNIRITPDGHVFLVDFGLAKQMEGSQLTATGARGLTPGYSPPEQYGTARTDARSDIYALGATLYTALTGFPPEDGLAIAIKQTKLTPVTVRNPKISPEVGAVIEKALRVDAEERYQSGNEFKRAMTEVSETVTRQVAIGDVTVSPPPAEATLVAGEMTLPSAWQPAGPVNPPAAAKKKFPWGWIIGGSLIGLAGLIAVAVVAGRMLIGPKPNEAANTQLPAPTLAASLPETPIEEPVVIVAPTSTNVLDAEQAVTPTEPPMLAATPTGGSGMIAYASTINGEPQIFLYHLDTGDSTQLTNIGGGACQPDWSPDGQTLVVVVPCSRNQQRYDGSSLFRVNLADGSHSPLPSSPIGDYDPDWSPVENKIVFTTVRDFDRPQIWVLDVDSGESVNLSNNSQFDFQPVWSPDGSKIIFASNRVINRGKLWVMDADGENLREFTLTDNRTNLEPVWAPDGDLVLYTQFDSRGGGVPKLMGNYWRDGGPQAGTVEFRISEDSLGMREPDLSPDGMWIVYAANSDPNNLDLYIMRVNGAEIIPIVVNQNVNDFDPAWRPLP
ncbi:MAG: protein kinase [Anaerolineales bacterium]|nr:protein kinase [Anaerolineales bacterium]